MNFIKPSKRLLTIIALLALNHSTIYADQGTANREIAAIQQITPLSALRPEERNGDYLNQIKISEINENLGGFIFHDDVSREMKEKYKAYTEPYEAKEKYQLNTGYDEMRYQQASKDLAEWTVKRLLQYHFEQSLSHKVEQSAKQIVTDKQSSEGTKTAAQTVMTISKVQQALKGTTIQLGDNKTRFKYDFPSGVMRVGLTGPIVEANLEYRLGVSTQGIGRVSQGERLNLGISKNFEAIKASTRFNYALMGETFNYGINKQLVGSLSAQIDQHNDLKDHSKDETLFRLNFGTSF